MTVLIKGLFLLSCLANGVNSAIQGEDISIKCSLSGIFPAWVKDGNTIVGEGTSMINPAFDRITYATDNSTLELSNLESGDAGTYTCSFAGSGLTYDVSVSVDVVAITSFGCPAEDSGFPFISCACATAIDVMQEFEYIFLDHDRKKKKVCPKMRVEPNSTGCSTGSVQEIAGFQYTKGERVCKKLRVNILGNLLHSSTGDTVHDSRNCTQDYYIDSCCCGLAISGYVLFAITFILFIIDDSIIFFKYSNIYKDFKWTEQKMWIFTIGLTFTIILGLAIFVGVVAYKVESILPDGDIHDCCECVLLEAFVAIMAFFTVLASSLLVGVLCLINKGAVIEFFRGHCCSGGPQTTSPLTTCMATCTTAPNSSPGNTEEKKKSRNNTKFKLQETGNETQTKPRPLPEKPIKAEPLQMKKPSPGIQDNKSRLELKDTLPLPPIKTNKVANLDSY